MILVGDVRLRLAELADSSVNCVVTSPPYWGLRDYGVAGQIGLEPTPEEYVSNMVAVFREVRRVLRDDGTLWLNLGDSYASIGRSGRKESPGVGAKQEMRKVERDLVWHAGDGSKFRWTLPGGQKPKDLIGIPWRVAFALQADGWWLRSDIIWHKPNPMPESVRDRCTKAHEYIFLLSKSTRYYYDAEAIAEPAIYSGRVTGRGLGKDAGRHPSGQSQLSNVGGFPLKSPTRNRRSVWTINPQPYAGAHFATFPPKLIEPCILAGCPEAGTLLDPFFGAGTTGLVAERHNRRWIGCELNPEYAELARRRIEAQRDMFSLQTLVEGR